MVRMNEAVPDIFKKLDGLSSHSYPNPGFSQPPWVNTKMSVTSFKFERDLVEQLSGKKLPVFITETGWAHGAGNLAQNYKIAYEQLWLSDGRVRAVTPFILNYVGAPFAQFSWKNISNETNARPFRDEYYAVLDIPKVHGEPPQIDRVNVI